MRIARSLVFALCCLAISAAEAPAQDKPAAGVDVGVTASRISPDAPGQTVSRRAGLFAGVYGELPISKVVGVLVEGVYVQKHSHTDTADLRLDYFEVPILAKLPLFKGLYITEGIGVAFPVRAQLKLASGAEQDIKDQTTNPDVGLIVGGGVPIHKVGIEFRYDGGFKRVSRDATVAVQRNRSFALLLRWHP